MAGWGGRLAAGQAGVQPAQRVPDPDRGVRGRAGVRGVRVHADAEPGRLCAGVHAGADRPVRDVRPALCAPSPALF